MKKNNIFCFCCLDLNLSVFKTKVRFIRVTKVLFMCFAEFKD